MNPIEKLIGRKIEETEFELLIKLKDEIYKLNNHLNLTRIPEDLFFQRHIIDSLLLQPFLIALNPKSVLDFGTGAGFPGIPLAIFNPNIEFFLYDKSKKKLGAVNKIVKFLKLKNVCVTEKEHKTELVVSRAVAITDELISITKNLFSMCGLAIKSIRVLDELKVLNNTLYCKVFSHQILEYPYNSVVLMYSNTEISVEPRNFQLIWTNTPFK